MPADYYNQRLADGKDFHCPAGHNQHFTQKDTLEKKNASLARQVAQERKRTNDALAEAAHFRKSRDGMKGALSKSKKKLERVKEGVCPCCNRSFVNLARHMKGQHPEFKH